MLYFLVKKGNELHIMRIAPHYEAFFRMSFDQQIIVVGLGLWVLLTPYLGREAKIASRQFFIQIFGWTVDLCTIEPC